MAGVSGKVALITGGAKGKNWSALAAALCRCLAWWRVMYRLLPGTGSCRCGQCVFVFLWIRSSLG